MIPLLNNKAPSTVLGLAFEKDGLHGVVLRRSNGSLNVAQSFQVALALNPFTGDPQLVGREIRNHLDQAGIRERRCVVCLPVSPTLFLLTEIPDMPDEDVPSFLEIEMERGFPYGLETLYTSTHRFRTSTGKQYGASVAISRNDVTQLEQAMRAAQLKPMSLSTGLTALHNPLEQKTEPVLSLAIGENTVDLQVSGEGGIVALRSLDEAFESEGQKVLSTEFLTREVRITRGQLPSEFRDSVRRVKVFGRGETARRFVSEITPRLESAGLQLDWVEHYAEDEFPKRLPPRTAVSPALSGAAAYLTGRSPAVELLPPKVHRWKQLTTRLSSRKLAPVGAVAVCLVLVLGGALGFQRWQLSRLQKQWAAMEPEVKELETLQQHIKTFRPWFDQSFRSLNMLAKITEAFPEEGVVTAKTLEIRDLSAVTCSGVAQDNQAFLNVLDRLRSVKEISDLKVDQVRGKTPMQFTFNFQWRHANEN